MTRMPKICLEEFIAKLMKEKISEWLVLFGTMRQQSFDMHVDGIGA